MSTDKKTRDHGLLIRKVRAHGSLQIEATLCSREEGRDGVLGVSDETSLYERPKHLADHALDGLGIYGFVSDLRDDNGKCRYIGDSVEFRNVYSIDQRRALRMAKTLKHVNAKVDKLQAFEPGDKLFALAEALKLSFVVEDRERFRHDPERRWAWFTVAEGRNRFRALIDEGEVEETTRLGPPRRAAS